MKILFAGKTGFDYNRTKILYNGLKKIKDVDISVFKLESKSNFDIENFKKITKDVDFIYVPPFRFTDARFIYKQTNIPVVFDPLVSTYLTRVVDYKQFWKAPHKLIVDKRSFNSCDILIADTENHKKYFIKKFNISANKIHVLPVGTDSSVFFENSVQKKDNLFHVGFYGSFVPLQGTLKIIETAKILQNNNSIFFDIIGDGHHFDKAKKLAEKYNLKNIKFYGRVEYKKLPELINDFDICLGIFGDSLKADLVIPNKVYHYASMNKCIITKDTVGIKEIFANNENIILSLNNPADIADKILLLKNNESLCNKIAKNAYNLISENYNEVKIAERFIKILKLHEL